MRKLIVAEMVTLDGVMEAPGGEPSHPHTGWVFDYQGDEQIGHKFREVQEADILLLGRVTYESFAGAWPTYEGEFADTMNAMRKVVVSNTLADPEWNNTEVVGGDAAKAVAALKAEDGGPILVNGSHTLVQALLDADLVDELRLMVFPVTIGAGLRVFPDTVRKTVWRRVGSTEFESGVWEDRFVPA
ncbi:dihydrofolate reductase family protein [Yinghuangia soli]|uniref:Dihydrofolate reductase family protein n=1 Tax=Yinghuangia soli TaxID=2908204 RepID=A0AA41U038_9ACTN|nr:dihydrofolate reductase family protein [Yinghuangia soli]MCF2527970.1 dihydrofolate reductase family protein [Yinghuangia soli]